MSEKEGGGLFGGLKNLIFEEEEPGKAAKPTGSTPPPAARPPQGAPAPRPMSGVPVYPGPTTYTAPAAVDPVIYEGLKKALREAALPAFDAFEKTMATFANIPGMTDDMKIQAAMGAITAAGQQPGQVLTDISECLDALTQKEAQATQATQNALNQAVGGREAKARQLGEEIVAKQAQIAELQRQIAEAQTQQSQVSGEIATAKTDIENKQRRFVATAAQIRQELTAMRDRLSARGQG